MTRSNRYALVAFVVAFVLALGALVYADRAEATGGGDEPCVPSEAYTEVIEHPAVIEVVHHDAVYATEYHFRKFTQTRTKAPDVKGFWSNFQPTKSKEPFVGPPTYPTDPRGKWSAPKTNGGPQPTASGVFQSGSGNGSWFYRQQASASAWSEYGPWTPWSPEQHTSWEDSDAPLGSPQPHGSGTYADGTKWERVWQARFDGQTRQGEVIEEAYDEEVIVKEAWTETIEHPAVVCPEEPTEEPTPTETPTVTPPVPTVTETVTPPVPTATETVTPPATTETVTPPTATETVTEQPEPEESDEPKPTPTNEPKPKPTPKDVRLTECVDGVFVTTLNGEVISESGSCDESTTTSSVPTVAQEEGL